MDRLCVTTKHLKMYIQFGTWKVSSQYKSGLFKTVARKLAKYRVGSEGVKTVI